MTEKLAQVKSGGGQMVPLADLLAIKKKAEKLESEVAHLKHTLEVVDLSDVEDADLKNMKVYFMNREAELNKREEALEEKETDYSTRESEFKEREKSDTIQSLTTKYAPKDKKEKDAFVAAVQAAEDPEKEAYKLYVERLSKEGENSNTTPPAEEVFDQTRAGGKIVKSPLNIDTTTPEGKKEMAEFRATHLAKV
jgi:hypothetical protein